MFERRSIDVLWFFVIRAVIAVALFSIGVSLVRGQSPLDPKTPEKIVDKIDVPNIVGLIGVPYPDVTFYKNGTRTARMICEVKVWHKDGTVYKEFNTSPYMNLEDDLDTMLAVKWGFDLCRDRTMQILSEIRAYARSSKKNTVGVKELKRENH